jgi:predicted transcriptional regulator
MSVATTVKLPPSLKKRIGPLARAAGKSPHAWMVEALATQVEREELHSDFVAQGLASLEGVTRGEPVFAADEVFGAVRARLHGRKAKRVTARPRTP